MLVSRWKGERFINERSYRNDVLEIELAGITGPNPDYVITKNIQEGAMTDETYVIEYVFSGVGYIESNDKKYVVSAGDVYFLNKLRRVTYYSDKHDPYMKEFIVVKGKLADCLATLYQLNDSVIVRHIDAHSIFEKIFQNIKQEKQIPNDELEVLVMRLFQIIRPQTVAINDRKRDYAEQVKEFLYTHIQEKLTLSDISQKLNISESTIQHSFSKKYKCSLMKYFMSIKLNYAKLMLRQTDYSLEFIAQYLSFCDEKYFGKCFKKEYGITPGEYRKIQDGAWDEKQVLPKGGG